MHKSNRVWLWLHLFYYHILYIYIYVFKKTKKSPYEHDYEWIFKQTENIQKNVQYKCGFNFHFPDHSIKQVKVENVWMNTRRSVTASPTRPVSMECGHERMNYSRRISNLWAPDGNFIFEHFPFERTAYFKHFESCDICQLNDVPCSTCTAEILKKHWQFSAVVKYTWLSTYRLCY